MLEVILWRGLLVAAPFVGWFLWRAWARRTGRPMGATPWSWLFAAGCLLVVLSLVATVLLRPHSQGGNYVPGEVGPDGRVSEGRFEPGPVQQKSPGR